MISGDRLFAVLIDIFKLSPYIYRVRCERKGVNNIANSRIPIRNRAIGYVKTGEIIPANLIE